MDSVAAVLLASTIADNSAVDSPRNLVAHYHGLPMIVLLTLHAALTFRS